MAEVNLVDKLVKIQDKLNVPKNNKNTFGGYNYRSAEDILEKAKPLCKGEGLALLLEDELVSIGDRYYVKATASVSDGDKAITATGYAREAETKKGMDESQITGAASSYARKYALNGLFAIDDTKDADTDEHLRQTAPERTETKKTVGTGKVSTKQVNFIMSLLNDLGASSTDDKKELFKEITGFESISKLTSQQASDSIAKLQKALESVDDDIDLNEEPEF